MFSNLHIIIQIVLLIVCTISLCKTRQSIDVNDDDRYHCLCRTDNPVNIELSVNKSIDLLKQHMSHHMIPGLAFGVSRYGRHIVNEPIGWADLENNVPIYRDSEWRLASISKSITSALVARLIEDNRLNLNDSIYKYLKPGVFPRKQWKGREVDITLGQLMSHTGGTRVTKILDDSANVYEYTNVTESIAQFSHEPLISAPGTQYNYSNFGWQLVGAVIESITGENFNDTINKFVRDIHMPSTYAETYEMLVRHRVHDYIKSDSEYLLHPTKNKSELHIMNAMLYDDLLAMEAQWPCGALMSTVDNLLTFSDFMLDSYNNVNHTKPDLLKSETIKQLWKPIIDAYSDDFGTHKQAHGWLINDLKNPIQCTNKCQMPSTIKRVIWKSGGLTGLTTIIMIFPEQHICVTLLTNNSDFDEFYESALIIGKLFMM